MSERSNLSKNGSEARGGRLRAIGMVRLAVVTAIIILMAFTPIGYLKYGPLSITFLQIPVVVGAIVLGPASGAFLGGVFGATSLAQCFGLDAFGTMLFGLNPVGTIILTMIPRILMGFISGLIFKGLYKVDKTRLASYAITTLSGAILNTLFFMSAFVIFFYDTVMSMAAEAGKSLFPFLVTMVGLNGVVVALVCFGAGAAIAKALDVLLNRRVR